MRGALDRGRQITGTAVLLQQILNRQDKCRHRRLQTPSCPVMGPPRHTASCGNSRCSALGRPTPPLMPPLAELGLEHMGELHQYLLLPLPLPLLLPLLP